MTKKIKTIVFPVGGFGTRFLPATKATPKEMLPVAEKPLIQYAFEEAMEAGIEKFIFVTGRNKNSIENHFDNAYELQDVLDKDRKDEMLKKTIGWVPKAGQIAYIRQQKPLGLGHAILCAKNYVGNEPFVVTLADEMIYKTEGNFLKDMIGLYEEKGSSGNVLAVNDVKNREDVRKYGIVSPKSDDGRVLEIKDMVEKPKPEEAPSQTTITGRYILQPEIFKYLEKTEPGKGGEIQITDAMKAMMSESNFYGLRFTEDRFDCGSIVGYLEANLAFALKNEKIKLEVIEILRKYSNKFSN